MSKKGHDFEVGQIVKNSFGQYTQILSIVNDMFGLSGWSNLVNAKKSNIVTTYMNIFGMLDAELEITDEVADPEASDKAPTLKDGEDEEDIELAKYLVISEEIYPSNEDGSLQDTPLELYSVQEIPTEVGDQYAEEGKMEKVPTKTSLTKLSADAVKALAEKYSLSTEGTKPEILERVFALYQL